MAARPRLLFFVTEDWYFCSHRLPLALAARDAGYGVSVVTRTGQHGELIRDQGLGLIPLQLDRHGTNPWRDLGVIARLSAIYRREAPDILHQVALKPVLYGSLAARLVGLPGVINALAGLGFLFSSEQAKARLLRPAAHLGFRTLLGGRRFRVILQNPDDQRLFERLTRMDPRQIHLIRGSGVDLTHFIPRPEPPGDPVVMLPSRLLWEKGVREFVTAAASLRQRGLAARFVLVGEPDSAHPDAVPGPDIKGWVDQGLVEWWGYRKDMAETLAAAHLVCLPSWREGLPKALLEAAASGRAIVTTDAPGCREVVRDGVNGLLVPVRDAPALTEALACLIGDTRRRQDMGRQGRALAEAEFGVERVVAATLALYESLLADTRRPSTAP